MLKEPSTLFGQYARLQIQALSRLYSIVIILFLASLVLLAILRLFSGVSIKRFGYLALCGVSFRTKTGKKIQIGRIGLHVHRPTVARPGWFEIVIKNLEVEILGSDSPRPAAPETPRDGSIPFHFSELFEKELKSIPLLPESQVWARRIVRWLIVTFKVVNISINSLLVKLENTNYVVSSVSLRLDLRNLVPLRNSNFVGTLDAYELKPTEIRAAFAVSLSEFFVADSLDDENPHPVLDNFNFNTTGVLDKKTLELKELCFQVFVHNMHIQLENLLHMKGTASRNNKKARPSPSFRLSRSQRLQLAKVGVAVVYLVKEIDIKFNSFEITKIPPPHDIFDKNGKLVRFVLSMTDISLNIRRMNPSSPGFKLLYSDSPAAHQASLKMSSINFGIDAGGVQEELIYVPLVTLLCQTNLASKSLSYVQDEDAMVNNSVVSGAFNVNSPTLNIETHHLPILLQLLRSKKENKAPSTRRDILALRIPPQVQNALPRTDLCMHVSEAALRIVFDGEENPNSMFITSCSRIHSRVEGSHQVVDGRQVYVVDQDFEIIKGLVWYRSDLVPRFVISSSERILLQMAAVTQPQLSVDVNITLSNMNHTLTRYEIFHAIRCLTETIRPAIKKTEAVAANARPPAASSDELKPSPLRKLPAWLRKFNLDAKNIKIVLASERFRGQTSDLTGIRVELDAFSAEYVTGPEENSTDGRELETNIDNLTLCTINTDHVNRPHPSDKIRVGKPYFELQTLKCVLSAQTVDDIPHVAAFVQVPSIKLIYSMNVLLSASVVRELLDHAYGRDLLPPRPKNQRQASEKMNIKGEIDYLRAKVMLPNNEDVMLTVTKGLVEYYPTTNSPGFKCDGIKLYSLHPFNNSAWCVIMSLVHPQVEVHMESEGDQILVTVDGFRVNVPFDFKLYRIIDNAITFGKAMRTTLKQTSLRDPLFIIQPHEAKIDPQVPRVGVRAKSLALTLEDDPFESDLSLIFQTMRHETEARIQKELLFEKEVKAVLEKEGMELIDQYAEKIAERVLRQRPSSSTLPEFGKNSKTETNYSFKHAVTDQFMCRSCKNGKKRGFRPLLGCNNSHATCMFCKGDERSHRIRNSLASSVKSSSSKDSEIKSVAKDLKERIEKLLASPMDLVACTAVASEATQGWSDLWISPEFYPWRQLKLSLDSLEHCGFPVEEHIASAMKKDDRTITIFEARKRLLKHNTESWVRSITDARSCQTSGAKKTLEQEMPDSFDEVTCTDEVIVGYSPRPLLFNASFKDVYWQISRSKFETAEGTRKFIHDIGKGVPMDQRYSIFVPLYFHIKAQGGFNLKLRDYPLPVLNFPPLSAMQDPRNGPALEIRGNYIIAEQLSPSKAQIRPLFVPLFPDTPSRHYSVEKEPSWAVVEVHRTLSPIKMFTDLNFVTNSDLPTRFCWCSAYKPAFQNMQNGFSSFSKPPIDLSAAMGFWDKIRLIFHARLSFNLQKSSLYFLCKGGRSPYQLIRGGAGFAFIWDKNVTVRINEHDDPKHLFVVKSEVFKTVIPDYTQWERDYLSRLPGERAYPLRPDLKAMLVHDNQKVVMKFSNSTEWAMGMCFQRKVDKDKKKTDHKLERTDEFRPHYDIKLTMPDFVKNKSTYDAYHGFRSDFVFLAISVHSLESMGEPGGWNAVHLSPLVVRHFLHWKEQFKNSLWPPIRSGKLFPGETPKKTKLGSVLSGQQYQLALEPLYISFMARHLSHHGKNQIIAGAKARIDKFVLDLHSRKEPVGSWKRWETKLYQGQVSATHMEVRVVSATTHDTTVRQAKKHMRDDSDIASMFSSNMSSGVTSSGPTSQTSSTNVNSITESKRPTHTDWIDYDDYTDISYDFNPKTKPKVTSKNFVCTPYLSYVKETDRSNDEIGEVDGVKYFKFGRELIHNCLFTNESPWTIHEKMLRSRRKTLEEIAEDNRTSLENLAKDRAMYPENVTLSNAEAELDEIIDVCHSSMDTLSHSISVMERSTDSIPEDIACGDRAHIFRHEGETDSFVNQVTVHSINVKWNDDVRDLVLRLKVLFSLHKEAVYTRTRRALKYLSDLVDELENQADGKVAPVSTADCNEVMKTIVEENGSKCEIIRDKDDPTDARCKKGASAADNFERYKKDLTARNDNESVENNLIVRFITPQIQVVSLRNPDKCIQITSRTIDVRQVKVYESYESDVDWDAAEIETRYGVVIDQGNLFTFSKENISRSVIANLCSADYSSDSAVPPVGSVPWPPWLGIEFCINPGVLRRFLIAPNIEMCVRYHKLNEQHVQSEHSVLKPKTREDKQQQEEGESSGASEDEDLADHYDDHHKTSRYSQLFVNTPKLDVQCDSDQYFTAYTIVKDLLHYTDPLSEETERASERIALVIDVSSDYKYSLAQVSTLQNNLNTIVNLMDSICAHRFHNKQNVDRDLVKLELDYRRASMDLMITMRAFKAALRRSNKTDTANILYTTLLFDEVLGTVLNEMGKPFMEMSVVKAQYRNFTRGEQFSHTLINLGLVQAWNLMKDAYYPDIMSPHGHFDTHKPFVKVEWTTLDPVGGIPIVENISVDMRPIKVQLERNLYNVIHSFVVPTSDEEEQQNPGTSASNHGTTLIEYDEDDYSTDSSNDSENSGGEQAVTTTKKRSIVPGFAKKISHLVKNNARSTSEMNELVTRAANYMNISQFSIKETTIVASYKGTDSNNLLDVQDIAIDIPPLLYTNKLWTKQDLFGRLKKDMIKLVLSNTGQILGNKFTRHRKPKRHVSEKVSHNSVLERITSRNSTFSNISGPKEISRRSSVAPAIMPSEWHNKSKRNDQQSEPQNGSQNGSQIGHRHRHHDTSTSSTPSSPGSKLSHRESLLSVKSKGKSLFDKLKHL